jgi:cell division protein FtsB
MSIFKCFAAVWVSVVVYSILSLFFGASSFSTYEAVSSERDRLVENMEVLKMINQELVGTFNALTYDSDTIAVYARVLGYGARDERFIRIVGLPSVVQNQQNAGLQIIPFIPRAIPDKTIRIISFFAGVAALLFMVFGQRKKEE